MVRVWDTDSATLLRIAKPGESASEEFVSFSPDGNNIVSGTREQTTIWDAAKGTLLRTLSGTNQSECFLAISPDNHTIAVGAQFHADGLRSGCSAVAIVDLESGKTLHTLADHPEGVSAVAFSMDGTRVATATRLGTIFVWDALTGEQIHRGNGHGRVNKAGPLAATQADAANVAVWHSPRMAGASHRPRSLS